MADRVICHYLALPYLRKKYVSVFHKLFENEYRVKGASNYFPPPQTEKQRDALKTSLLMAVQSSAPRRERRLPQEIRRSYKIPRVGPKNPEES